MLAIQARALSKYILMQSDNEQQPPNYIGNKVAGITFQNKAQCKSDRPLRLLNRSNYSA
jgi:endoglucanase Acf2